MKSLFLHAAFGKRAFLAGLLALSLSACGEKKNPVRIVVEPPSVQVVKVKATTTAAKKQVTDHEIARTDWMYSIQPELDIAIKDERKQQDGYHVWITLTGVKLKLALPIKTYVSEKAPNDVLNHEKGHVEICKRIYENSREYATKAANSAIGKTFEGFGTDRKLALSNALQIAAQEVTSPYRKDTSALADQVSSNYDLLCEKEDRTSTVEKTVAEAFASSSESSSER